MAHYGGYALDLYCDKCCGEKWDYGEMFDGRSHQISQIQTDGPTAYKQAYALAKKRGWILKKNGTAICPRCSNIKP